MIAFRTTFQQEHERGLAEQRIVLNHHEGKYTFPPFSRNTWLISAIPASALSAARNVSTPAFCFAAKSLTSCVIFIEQNFGPHIEQKWAVLAPPAGRVWSW